MSANRKAAPDDMGCEHQADLGYMGAVYDAEERTARGEVQAQCATCERWRWPHMFNGGCPDARPRGAHLTTKEPA